MLSRRELEINEMVERHTVKTIIKNMRGSIFDPSKVAMSLGKSKPLKKPNNYSIREEFFDKERRRKNKLAYLDKCLNNKYVLG